MKFDLFKSQTENYTKTPLKNFIENYGVYDEGNMFSSIFNSLDTDYGEDKFALMTYAYVRRQLAAYLYIQGWFGREEINYQQQIFKAMQLRTNVSKQFQIDAANAGTEFLNGYSDWFSPEKANFVLPRVINEGHIPDRKSMGELYPDDVVMRAVDNWLLMHGTN